MFGRVCFIIFSQLFIGSSSINISEIPNFSTVVFQLASSNVFCALQLNLLQKGLENGEEWAIRMIDATAKPQAGLFLGNIMHIGNYDECLEVGKIYGGNKIRGKYCTALFRAHEKYGQGIAPLLDFGGRTKVEKQDFTTKMKFSYGFCVPEKCKAKDLQLLTDFLVDQYNSSLSFKFFDDYCDAGDGQPFSTAAIFTIFVFSLFAVILVASTVYDVCYYQKLPEKNPDIYMAFSVVTNGKKLISTKTGDGTLGCLNGFRVISMMWIMLGHRFMGHFFVPEINIAQIEQWQNATENAIFPSMAMAVDTFFTISGLLVVFVYMKNQDKNIPFSLPVFYLHRILRLTPSLAMVVLFSATLLRHMGDGPFWIVVYEMYQKPCETNWWTTLTYLQNYVHNDNQQCHHSAWYLAVDTQMYFISPLIFIPLVKWPKKVMAAIVVFVIFNSVYVFAITFFKQLGVTFFEQDHDQYNYLYSPTHVRGTVYLMGMVCGYFIYQTRKKRPLLCKKMVVGLWTGSLLVLIGIVLGFSYFLKYKYPVWAGATFNALIRVSWSLALCVLIFLCVNGYGGVVDTFLSHKIFTFLIRINYNVYLLHLLIILLTLAQARTPLYFSNLVGFHLFWGDYAYSVAVAVLWTLAFESPGVVIENIIFGKRKSEQNAVIRDR